MIHVGAIYCHVYMYKLGKCLYKSPVLSIFKNVSAIAQFELFVSNTRYGGVLCY